MATERVKEIYRGIEIRYAESGEKWVAYDKRLAYGYECGDTLKIIKGGIDYYLDKESK